MKLHIKLDPQSGIALSDQIYERVRQLILSGRLKPGERLPSSRSLSEATGVSRPTVTLSYDQLLAEGYLESRHGSGTYVTSALPAQFPRAKVSPKGQEGHNALSRYARELLDRPVAGIPRQDKEPEICFYTWRPSFDDFPLVDWARVVSRHTRAGDWPLLDYSIDSAGEAVLRAAIVTTVQRTRGITCHADNVVIVWGLQQAIDLVCRVHVDAGDAIVVENPGYSGIREAVRVLGAVSRPVAVDEHGLVTAKLPQADKVYKLAYVTPSHQFPLGSVLSLSRRLELLDWARRSGATIFEDDYDSEYRYRGKPIPALMSLDNQGSVVYTSSFAKVMFPSLGIAYLIVPDRLIEVYRRARWLAADQVPTQLQIALAEFIADGHLERHVKRMRAIYDQRRRVLVSSIEQHFGTGAQVSGDNAGLHLILSVRTRLDDSEAVEEARRAGVGITAASQYYLRAPVAGKFMLGFGNLSEADIEEGVRRLARVLR